MLLAGGPKAEVAILAAEASASDRIDRTFWLTWEERTPDGLGAVPGNRIEIVEHDGSLDDFEAALAWADAEPVTDKPHLVVLDGPQLWDSIKDAETRASIDSGLPFDWEAANDRWARIFAILRGRRGPSVVIGRLADGAILGHKSLEHAVDVVAEVADNGAARVTATRTAPPIADEFPTFAVPFVWDLLAIEGEATA